MFEDKAYDTAHNDYERLSWNHALVWKQPLKAGRKSDADDTADCSAKCDEDV